MRRNDIHAETYFFASPPLQNIVKDDASAEGASEKIGRFFLFKSVKYVPKYTQESVRFVFFDIPVQMRAEVLKAHNRRTHENVVFRASSATKYCYTWRERRWRERENLGDLTLSKVPNLSKIHPKKCQIRLEIHPKSSFAPPS